MTPKVSIFPVILLFLTATLFSGCDPTYFGQATIRNASNRPLLWTGGFDSSEVTHIIPPNSVFDLGPFYGRGSGYTFDCCPCEYFSFALEAADTTEKLLLPFHNKDVWLMINTNKKRNNGHEIICEFIVLDENFE